MNRLVSSSDGTTTVTYQYDGQGRRTERIVGGTAEHYYYSGQRVVETRLPDGQGGLQPEQQYVWSLRYIDSPILRDSYSSGELVTGDRLYYLTDANNNVTAVTDAAGTVQERYDYDAFGKATVYDANWSNPGQTSTVGNTRLFAGQDVDPATGLQYARARWYNVNTGGFITRDPSSFAAGDVNLYRYVGNNPVIYVDPSGMYRVLARGAIGGLSGWAAGTATGFAAGGVMGGPPGAAAGAMAGGIWGGIGGFIAAASMSSKETFGNLAAAGLGQGLVAGLASGIFAGAAAAAEAAAGEAAGAAEAAGAGEAAGVGGEAAAGAAGGATEVAAAPSIPQVSNIKLSNIVSDLYKGARGPNPIGTGSTADAVRNELLTGQPTFGTFHSQKAGEYVTALSKWLAKNPNAPYYDRVVARSLLDDLVTAIGGN